MADGGEKSGGDYVTFRELVKRETELRNELKGYVNERDDAQVREMNSRFTNFGHEVAKQFVEEREKLRDEKPDVHTIRQQVVEMASGNRGRGMQLFGVGLILLAIALMMHAPWVAKLLPF